MGKKFFAFPVIVLLTLAAVAGFSGTAHAEGAPPAIANEYWVDGDCYYNVHSANFADPKKFYTDVVSAKHNWLQLTARRNHSLAALWLLVASAIAGDDGCAAEVLDLLEVKGADYSNPTLSYFSPRRNQDTYQYQYFPPEWNSRGELQTVICIYDKNGNLYDKYGGRPPNKYSFFQVCFSDFQLGVFLPGNTDHYLSKIVREDNGKDEQVASAKNDSNSTVTISQQVSKTKTESATHTISHSKATTWKVGLKVAFGPEKLKKLFGLSAELSGEWNRTTTEGTTDSTTKTITTSNSNTIQVTLPPCTTALLKQGEDNTTVTTRYNCPLAVSYKVTILMGGNNVPRRFYTFGPDARENLRQRAVDKVNDDPEGINWGKIRYEVGNNYYYRTAIDNIGRGVPMSSTGATMVYKKKTTYNEVSGIAPLYPLSYITLNRPNISFVDENRLATMRVGNYSCTEYLPIAGYNARNVEYYGFDKDKGHWAVVGEDGQELPAGTAPVKIEKSSIGGNTKFTAVKPGKCYLKYLIDEKSYPIGMGTNTYVKNSDLARTAVLTVNVLEVEEVEEKVPYTIYEISGDYSGEVGAAPDSLEGDGKLEVAALDSTGKEVEAYYEWEAKELKGIKLTSDGKVSFTRPKTFHVRVRNKKGNIYSDWKAITAKRAGSAVKVSDSGDEEDEEVSRTIDAYDDTNFVLNGSFTGGVSADAENIEGTGKLSVETCDSTMQEEPIRYLWEEVDDENNTNGMELTGDGMVTFTAPGIYHARVKSGEFNSVWVELRANEKAPARLLQAPTANDGAGNGMPLLLSDDARYEGGIRMLYGLGSDENTAPNEYSSEIPTATDAEIYYVWCMVQPDENHDESEPVCVTVTAGGQGSSSRGSSGCDAGLGFAGLVLVPALARKRK